MPAPKPAPGTVPSYGMIQSDSHIIDKTLPQIVFWEEGNPRCVINLLTVKLKEKVLELPPTLLAMKEEDLEKMADPSPIDEQLRLSFWDEYFVACDSNVPMRMDAIYGPVCSRAHFYKNVVENPHRLAYMLRPPQDYMLRMRSLLELGLKQFEKILRSDFKKTINVKGGTKEVIDTKLVGEIVKIFSIIDTRVKGAVAQKLQVEQKNMHLHANAKDFQVPQTHAEIQNELARVQSEIRALEVPAHQPDEEILINGIKDVEETARSEEA